jgi:hypothetical protein
MKKTIYALLILFVFTGCEKLGLEGSESKLIGSWIHQGIKGEWVYKGKVGKLDDNSSKGEILELMKNGKVDYDGFDKYTTKGDRIIFSNSSTGQKIELTYEISGNTLELYQNTLLYKLNDKDPDVTFWDLTSTFTRK